jgi:hypothetical protein
MTDEQILAALKENNRDLINQLGPRIGMGSQTAGQAATGLGNGLNNVITSFGGIASGSYNLTSAINDVTKVLGIFGPVGDMLGKTFGNVAGQVLEWNAALKVSGNSGVDFGQNLGEFARQIGEAGIPMSQFPRILIENQKAFAGSGMNAQLSAEQFLSTTKALRNNQQVIQAEISGIDFSVFQDQLISTTNLLKFSDLESVRTQKLLQESTIASAIEIDNMSRITGKSRQEVQKDIKETADKRTEAMMQLAMNPEELARFNLSKTFMSQAGPQAMRVFTEMSANRGNIVTKEGNEQVAALSVISKDLPGLFRTLSQENDPGKRRELETRIQFAFGAAVEDKERMRFLTTQANSGNAVMKSAVDTLRSSSDSFLGSANKIYTASGGDYQTFKTNLEAQSKSFAAVRESVLTGRGPGGEGALTAQTINALERAIVGGQASTSRFLAELNDKAAKGLSGEVSQKAALEKILGVQTLTGDKLTEWVKSTGFNTNTDYNKPGALPNDPRATPRYTREAPMPVSIVEGVNREAVGSKQAYGNWFEGPLNRLSMLGDGGEGEASVPFSQAGQFVQDIISQNPGILAGLQGGLRSSANEFQSRMPSADIFNDLLKSINVPATVSPTTTAMTGNFGSITQENKTTSDLHTSLEKLNTKMDKLISTMEDSSSKNVKAIKSRGNAIA